jgi:DNA-binding CsgD family transcriptional regulator
MLQPLCLGPSKVTHPLQSVPGRLQPLIAAANRGDDVAPIVDAIARSFGFDGFMYGVSLTLRPNSEGRQYVYTTWPPELTRVYDENAFIEIDPRIHDLLESVVPLVWDQATFRGRSTAVDYFLDTMQEHGVASGIVCPIRDMHGRMAILALSSGLPANDGVRRVMIADTKGEIFLFGLYFHELYVNAVTNQLIPPHLQGEKLSARERECLTMAAHGLNGEDIASRLSIGTRTVQHHFDSIRGKLGAINRLEAVVLALAAGIITL